MSGLTGEESPQEKEERLQSREERLGKQHERLQEGSSVHRSSHGMSGIRSGGSTSGLGSPHPNTESFIGEHKVMIMVGAGIAVMVYVLWNMNSNPSPASALSSGYSTAPQGGTATGPNVGTTNDAGTTYGIQQLTKQLGAIQTSLTNQLNAASGSANLPAAGSGNGPVNLLAVAQPDATNAVTSNYISPNMPVSSSNQHSTGDMNADAQSGYLSSLSNQAPVDAQGNTSGYSPLSIAMASYVYAPPTVVNGNTVANGITYNGVVPDLTVQGQAAMNQNISYSQPYSMETAKQAGGTMTNAQLCQYTGRNCGVPD